MQQQELFDFRRDILFERDNQIARFYDVLSETKDGISYAEHIEPKKKFSICVPHGIIRVLIFSNLSM